MEEILKQLLMQYRMISIGRTMSFYLLLASEQHQHQLVLEWVIGQFLYKMDSSFKHHPLIRFQERLA